MLEHLNGLDQRLFLWLNEKHSAVFDPIMYWASYQWFWIPLYAFLGFWLYRRFGRFALYFAVWIVFLIALSDQCSSHLKDWVCRPRPSHELRLLGLVHLSAAGPGGEYGFVSSHAANCFALCVFVGLLLSKKDRPLKVLLLCWALLVSYSRIYNGVHYPGDVLGGILLGSLLGWLMTRLFRMTICFYLVKIKRH